MTRQEYLRNWRAANKEKRAAYNKAWWANNPTKSREYSRKHPEKNAARMRKWRAENPERDREIRLACYWRDPEKWCKNRRRYKTKRTEHLRARLRKWTNDKRKSDPIYKLISNFRSRLNSILRGRTKSAPMVKLLGCSLEDFKIHLESFFEPEMHWGNYGNKEGQWSVDHVMPFAIFDLSKPEHQRRVCHFSNLRPMWHVENMKKHAKPITDQFNLL